MPNIRLFGSNDGYVNLSVPEGGGPELGSVPVVSGTPSDGDALVYDAATKMWIAQAPNIPTFSEKIRQIVVSKDEQQITTTSTDWVAMGESATITPTASDSILHVNWYGTWTVSLTSPITTSTTSRFAWIALDNETDNISLGYGPVGRVLGQTSDQFSASFGASSLFGTYSVSDTSPKTFQFYARVANSLLTFRFNNYLDTYIVITEVAP